MRQPYQHHRERRAFPARGPSRVGILAVLGACLGLLGCHTLGPVPLDREPRVVRNVSCDNPFPRELNKNILPDYVIEPPDILLINALTIIPKPPYRVGPLDSLLVNVQGTFEDEPIAGLYVVEPDGTIFLGPTYGSVQINGMTIEEVRNALTEHLKKIIKEPKVFVSLGQFRGIQQIQGEHLVRPDGRVGLGSYGSVRIVGLTLPQAKAAIEAHLSQFLLDPEVSVDVLAYNSKVFYIVFDGGGAGEQVLRLPVTGNDTVLDALSQANGLTPISNKHNIWVARPAPADAPCDQILPVDWVAITERGQTATNYQLLPGDRIYVKAQPMVTALNVIDRMVAPFERIFGFTLLGQQTIRRFIGGGGQGQGFIGFGF
jgi:polysaccharide export outer membrane protein